MYNSEKKKKPLIKESAEKSPPVKFFLSDLLRHRQGFMKIDEKR